ncbi:SAM domain-containing protein [Mesorhizobium sp. BHbsci]
MDVSAWLRDLGLGQYEQAFRENDIDAEKPSPPRNKKRSKAFPPATIGDCHGRPARQN